MTEAQERQVSVTEGSIYGLISFAAVLVIYLTFEFLYPKLIEVFIAHLKSTTISASTQTFIIGQMTNIVFYGRILFYSIFITIVVYLLVKVIQREPEEYYV